MSDTVADVLAHALARHGVTSIFGQSNPTAFMLAAERTGIRQVLYRTENAAGVMADASPGSAIGSPSSPPRTVRPPRSQCRPWRKP